MLGIWLPKQANRAQLDRQSGGERQLERCADPGCIPDDPFPRPAASAYLTAKRCGRYTERCYADVVHVNEPVKVGHSAAMAKPDLFISRVRATFQTLTHVETAKRQVP
jgi:hypothetical protein